jgi:predicted neuraminidase
MGGHDDAFYEAELIFPPEHRHNHASCILECPNGDLLVCWYNGSGEKEADDVRIEGARKRKGGKGWSRFVMADTPDYPDCNPCMFLDPLGRLWLIWATILANEWDTAVLKYRVSSSYLEDEEPRWEMGDLIHITPREDFVEEVLKACDEEGREELRAYIEDRRRRVKNKLLLRIGWMPRAHPLVLDGGRILLPLYSDGFDFSLIAISDDLGLSWRPSLPLISYGGIQPTLVRREDGTIVAYMRDNGPFPKRVMVSESKDRGMSWSPVKKTDLPNPGSGLEVIRLRNGHWLMVCNDTEVGRNSLVVMISEDEGRSWRWKRHLEHDEPGPEAGSYSYPSVVQGRDETIHITYSYHPRPGVLESIKYVHFDERWVLEGCGSGSP